MGLTFYSQTPVAVGCVHPTTRQKRWSAVEQNPDTRTLCRKHACNAHSKQRHVSDAKQVLLWKGWVLKQRLTDVQSRVGATATRAHMEPPLRTELFVDTCSARHQGNCRASTREIPATWISIRTQGTERCSCDKTAALARHKNTSISLCAQRNMFRRKDCCVFTPRAHLYLFPCATRHVHATTLLRSHAVSTLGSLSVRKDVLTPGAHLDLAPCAKRHVPSKILNVLTPRAHLIPSPK